MEGDTFNSNICVTDMYGCGQYAEYPQSSGILSFSKFVVLRFWLFREPDTTNWVPVNLLFCKNTNTPECIK